MAEQKDTVAEDKEIAEGLDFNRLKATAKELNGVIDQFNSTVEEEDEKIKKVRIVGAKKLAMFQVWRDAMDNLAEIGHEGIPASSVDLYMEIYPDEEEGEGATDGEVGDGETPDTPDETEPDETPEPSKPDKKKPAAKKKDKGNLGSSSPKPVENFADLKKRLQTPQSPTGHFDRFCLEGGTVEQILAKFLKFLADSGIEFKSLRTKHSVKAHITYRQDKGYIYEEEGDKIKLVGYEK